MIWTPPDEQPSTILAYEIFNSLACFYALCYRLEFPNVAQGTRYDLVTDIIGQQALFEALIVRLCRLDSSESTDWSLREVWKRLRSNIKDQKRVKRVDERLSFFRNQINAYKV